MAAAAATAHAAPSVSPPQVLERPAPHWPKHAPDRYPAVVAVTLLVSARGEVQQAAVIGEVREDPKGRIVLL